MMSEDELSTYPLDKIEGDRVMVEKILPPTAQATHKNWRGWCIALLGLDPITRTPALYCALYGHVLHDKP